GLFLGLKVESGMDFFSLNGDPDEPGFLERAKGSISKEEFMRLRSDQIANYRGLKDGNQEEKIITRNKAIENMAQQEAALRNSTSFGAAKDALLAAWTPIGPDPIPNGQTTGIPTPVSGRVTAIDVHPTNPDIVYV